jgi:ribosomal peptide maturation radical SAM protein 1
MPFGPLYQPAIGLTSLKGVLRQQTDHSVEILYLTIKFAEFVGSEPYSEIQTGNPYVDLAGEWIFSHHLFDGQNRLYADYIDDVLRRQSRLNNRQTIVPDAHIDLLLRVAEQVDPFLDAALDDVLGRMPRIVGFTSTFQQHVASLCLAKRIKQQQPDIFIVMGGGNCEGAMGYETIRQFPFVDAVVSGEGEIIFPRLVNDVLHGRSIDMLQGVFTQTNLEFVNVNGQFLGAPTVSDMDGLPVPDYDDFFVQMKGGIFQKTRQIRVLYETSRGCWWGERQHCTFCGLNGETMAYRSKSAERAIDELKQLTERYVDYPVWVVDNILDMKYLNTFIPDLAALDLDLELFYEVKANLRKNQLQAMRYAGIKHLQPGIESLNNHVLKLMKKGVSWLQNVQLLKWCKELGITVYWNIIWGFPGEHPDDYAMMAANVPLLHHLQPPVGSAQIRLDRFSPNFNNAEEYGFINMRPAAPYFYIYPFEQAILNNLAYHFNYDYREPRDVRAYTADLSYEVRCWRHWFTESDLLAVDLGEVLLIWDFRQVAHQPLTVLDSIQRVLYLACNQIQNKRQLAPLLDAHDVSAHDIEVMLRPLVEAHLMAQDGNSYLSLAVDLAVYAPSLHTVQQILSVADLTDVQLDETVNAQHLLAEHLTLDFFGVDAESQPIIYIRALENLTERQILIQLTEQRTYTIAGITIDM